MMSKVMPLAEAIRQAVRPGMSLHFGGAWAFPTAALFEIIRHFAGGNPGFTLIMTTGNAVSAGPFLSAGLARRVISSFLGDGYPVPGSNPAIQRAVDSQKVTIENWTMLSLTLRLLAGALNLPGITTRSILGSSLEDELGRLFRRMPNPFDPNEEIGLIPALRPDVNLTHGWAADSDGNVLLPVPLAGNTFGAMAAMEGSIVTVEKIVSPDVIRAHSPMTRLPGHAVRAVCHVPYGAYPLGCLDLGLPEGEGYAEDRAFMLEARAAARTEQSQTRWIRRWILDCPDHAALLTRVGLHRLDELRKPFPPESASCPPPQEISASERMIIAGSRQIASACRAGGYQTILGGIGAAHLASWLAEEALRATGVNVALLTEVGAVGFRPLPGDPYLFAIRNVRSARMATDTLTVLGMIVGNGQARCLGVLSAAQVDRCGNLNTTRRPDGGFLMGSGGANDIASEAAEVIVVARQSRERFVERVNYVTSPGTRVYTVITQLGVYRKVGGDLILSAVFGDEASAADSVHAARQACGWELQLAPEVAVLPLPDRGEREALRRFDPFGDSWRE